MGIGVHCRVECRVLDRGYSVGCMVYVIGYDVG